MVSSRFPRIQLVDLPGLFQSESNEQDKTGKQTGMALVEEHIKCKRNLILLVVSARTNFHNHAGPAVMQETANGPDLVDRVIGVMTSSDRALSVDESMRAPRGHLNSANLKIYCWHVLKNQDQTERSCESPEQSNVEDADFFLNDPALRRVPDSQRGIAALNATLKYAFWEHTRAALPGLIWEATNRIRQVECRLRAFGDTRTTELGRCRYLHGIAKNFETSTQ